VLGSWQSGGPQALKQFDRKLPERREQSSPERGETTAPSLIELEGGEVGWLSSGVVEQGLGRTLFIGDREGEGREGTASTDEPAMMAVMEQTATGRLGQARGEGTARVQWWGGT
jgi:hypothetical protein